MTRRRALIGVLVLVTVAVLAGWGPVSRNLRAAELLWSLSRAHGGSEPARALPSGVQTRDVVVPDGAHGIRARLYLPKGGVAERGLVLLHGIHYRGIDERRLVPFAGQLARAGLVVLTPELADLADYRITQRGVETIVHSVRWLSGRRELVNDRRVGVLGFSFAGGLSLVAAGDARVRDEVAFVTSVGGHHDLSRVLRFFARDRVETPAGTRPEKAHEYGRVVLIYGEIERFVPEVDRAPMRRALAAWLHEERDRARTLAAECRTPEAARLFARVSEGRAHELSAEIERLIAERGPALQALSPRGRLASIRAPVYLLHGSADSVIPPSETEWANLELAGSDHEALVSPLLDHVEVSRTASLGNQLDLVSFMGQML